MTSYKRKKLGQILVELGVITDSDVTESLEYAKKNSLRIGEAVVNLGFASEEDLVKALARQSRLDFVELDRDMVLPDEVRLIPEDLVRQRLSLPIGFEEGKLKIAVPEPPDSELVNRLRSCLDCETKFCLASKAALSVLADRYVKSNAETVKKGAAATCGETNVAKDGQTTVASFNLPKSMIARIKALAAATDTDQTAIVEAALDKHLTEAIPNTDMAEIIEKLAARYEQSL